MLDADTQPEFEGWLKTLRSTIEKHQDTKEEHQDTNAKVGPPCFPYMNVIPQNCDVSPQSATVRGRTTIRGHGKAPIPTPRSKTPSREGTTADKGLLDVNEMEDSQSVVPSVGTEVSCT